jgi:hypothetical protein
MKKVIGILMCLVLLAGAAMPAMACRRHHRAYYSSYRSGYAPGYAHTAYRNRYAYPRQSVYYDQRYGRGRTFWQKHRDKLTLAMGTGAGAALGGLIGGKRGAGIGALAGAGGSALYTYKLRDRHRRY